jgi:uncharacterized protein
MKPLAIRPAASLFAFAALLAVPGSLPAQAPKVADEGPQYDVAAEKDVTIPMRDGVRLAADLYRPANGGKPIAGKFPTRGTAARPKADSTPPEGTTS